MAQKGARLMGERKKFELQASYTQEQLAKLSPSDRYKLFWYEGTKVRRSEGTKVRYEGKVRR